jgi:branched-chain amino acid transport system permease protein
MSPELAQYLLSGITLGAIYALVALGFSIIFNASHVINFAQGEFVMIGGMTTVSLIGTGLPLPFAIAGAVAVAAGVGLALEKFAVEPARGAPVVTLIIITIGASIFLRGLATLVWDKKLHALPAFSGNKPIEFAGAALLPQSLWVIGVTLAIVLALSWFFGRTLPGKAILATSHQRLAAQLVGINVRTVLFISFGLSAALGAIAGILIAPITLTSWDVGIMLGLKGFAAAVLGGLGSGAGAVLGGLVLGIAETLSAGYLSSAYKDVIAFVLMLAVLFFMPRGLLGGRITERV